MDIRIFPPEEFPEGIIDLPKSKSISNRVLIINAFCGNKGSISDLAQCDDTDAVVRALVSTDTTVDIGAAGTAMRFLTAYFASRPGREVVLTGSERMLRRPIGILVDALRQCGADITYEGVDGFPPLRIKGRRLEGGEITLSASVSSQFISALLMAAPLMSRGLKLNLEGEVVSRPYIAMTLGLMKEWGVESHKELNSISVAPQEYSPIDFAVEADWSAASYWYELAALSSGDIALKGLQRKSLQGDSRISEFFSMIGVESEWEDDRLELTPTPDGCARINIDLSEQPDLAQTIAVTCCALAIPFRLTGLSTLKIKETDRLTALRDELRKLTFELTITDDCELSWEGARYPVDGGKPVMIDTYDDHRMAMAFAPLAVFLPSIIIRHAEVVTKSYPAYWDDLRKTGFTIEEEA